jgi:hypothetical protein
VVINLSGKRTSPKSNTAAINQAATVHVSIELLAKRPSSPYVVSGDPDFRDFLIWIPALNMPE